MLFYYTNVDFVCHLFFMHSIFKSKLTIDTIDKYFNCKYLEMKMLDEWNTSGMNKTWLEA